MKKSTHHFLRNMSQEKLEERRKRAAKYFQRNKGATWIAEVLGVSRTAVHLWKRRWIKNGMVGLTCGTYGRSPKLTKHQESIIRRDIAKGAKKFGYPTNRWTLKILTAHVKKTLRVEYAERSLWHVLRRANIAPQRPFISEENKMKHQAKTSTKNKPR